MIKFQASKYFRILCFEFRALGLREGVNMMNKKHLITTIVIAILVGAVGFYAGIQYQKSQRSSVFGNFQRGNGAIMMQGENGKQQGGNTMMRAGGPVAGEITKIDDNTITVKTNDGSSKIVIYSSSTKVNKTTEGSKSDLTVGEKIMVIGSTGSDGAVTAQTISVGGTWFMGGPREQSVQGDQQPTGN
jgi:hypothetical protein